MQTMMKEKSDELERDELDDFDASADDSMDQMKIADSMEEFNHLQKLQNKILQKLIEKIDQSENK